MRSVPVTMTLMLSLFHKVTSDRMSLQLEGDE